MTDKSNERRNWTSLRVGLGLLAIVSFTCLLLPYEVTKPLVDTAAPDGSLDLYTLSTHRLLQAALVILGIAFIAFVFSLPHLSSLMSKRPSLNTRRAIIDWLKGDLSEIRRSIGSLSQDKVYGIALLLITLVAAVIRASYLSQPMQHDEAYTYTAFASRTLWNIISDYHLPNNHVFHTILVYLSTQLFGNMPWSVRLPAFLAGVLLVPVTYLAGRMLYNQDIGLMGSILVALSPQLIDYSANGRGYTLLCLITLLTLSLAAYLKGHKNIIAWSIFAMLSSLGFYTLPVMLYPFAMIITWLLLSGLYKDLTKQSRRQFFLLLAIFFTVTLILSMLLYAPIFYVSGFGAVVSNQYIRFLGYTSLWESLAGRVAGVHRDWLAGLPGFLGIFSLVAVGLGLIFHRRISVHRVPLQLAALLGISIVLTIQRVAPLPRIWLFLLPLATLWISAGIMVGVRILLPPRWQRLAASIVVLALYVLPASYYAVSHIQTAQASSLGVEEEVAIYLRSNLRPGDLVVVQPPLATPLEYYFMRYNLPLDVFDERRDDIDRVLVVVSSKYQQTLEDTLAKKGPRDVSQYNTLLPIHKYKHVTLYELSR